MDRLNNVVNLVSAQDLVRKALSFLEGVKLIPEQQGNLNSIRSNLSAAGTILDLLVRKVRCDAAEQLAVTTPPEVLSAATESFAHEHLPLFD